MSHPALDPQPQRITALRLVPISRRTEGRRLSWPMLLVTYRSEDGSSVTVPIVRRPGIELTTIESQIRGPNHYTTEPTWNDAGVGDDRNDVDRTHHGLLHVHHWLAVLRRWADSQTGTMLRTVHGRCYIQFSSTGQNHRIRHVSIRLCCHHRRNFPLLPVDSIWGPIYKKILGKILSIA